MGKYSTGTGYARLAIAAVALFGVFGGVRVEAQQPMETCPALVETAIAQTSTLCRAAGRNEICYGFDTVRTEPNDALSTPGDVTSIDEIESVTLARLNAAVEQWGMALARLQVNLPDTLPGENVAFLIYGDVTFEPENTAITPGAAINAFRLRTGIRGVTCGATRMTGLLVQTPDGMNVGNVKAGFTLNGVEIRMGSTVALTASIERGLRLYVLEGAVVVRANGQRGIALAGSRLTVPLDGDLRPAGVPGLPVPYNREELERLPVRALDRHIVIAEPINKKTRAELIRLLWGGEDLDDWLDSGAYRHLLRSLRDETGVLPPPSLPPVYEADVLPPPSLPPVYEADVLPPPSLPTPLSDDGDDDGD